MSPAARRNRRPRTALAALLGLALLTTACGRDAPTPVNEQFFAFGTLVELTLYGPDAGRAAAIASELAPRVDAWHAAWHPWEGDGLARINRHLARGEPASVDADLAGLLREARQLAVASGHRFNPAIGGLVRLWGFGLEPPPDEPPPAARVAALVAAGPRLTDLRFSDGSVRTANTAVQIDLGAFAKGVAVRRLVTALGDEGVAAGIVNAGGDLQVFGRPGERDWRIGVRHPDGDGVLATVTVRPGESVFTSGDYERGFTDGGARYHHILDPRTGYPTHGVRSVTVLHPDPARADAAATALFVADAGAWRQVADRLGIELAMRVDGDGRIHITEPMEARLSFPQESPPPLIRPTPDAPTPSS